MSRRAEPGDLPIDLDRSGAPIQRALYDALRDAMLNGRLRSGRRLPSSRDLGRQLGVARGTVVAVYERLSGEGYLTARAGSGTVVATELPDRWFSATKTTVERPKNGRARLVSSRWAHALAAPPFPTEPRRNPRPFRPHVPAVDAFPVETWTRLLGKRARRDESLLLSDADTRGYRPLREALAEHLRVARGVVCGAEQIVIVPSVQQVVDLVTRLTVERGEEVWMEDPGYPGARAVFESLEAAIVAVPVDADGLDVAAGIRRAPLARLVYVTPGHQAPLGVTMTIERRLALLTWAGAHGAVVIEDDYDSEYRYEGRPVPALQGLDRAGVVVHAGTFSKTLVPSLRLAYAVIPDSLLDAFIAAKSIVDRFTPPLSQAVLADFIEGGHFGRHLRQMRELYAERRGALLGALEGELGDRLEVVGASAGLSLTVRHTKGWDDVATCRALAASAIESLPLSPHSLSSRSATPGLILGFAPFSPARLRKGVVAMREVLAEVK